MKTEFVLETMDGLETFDSFNRIKIIGAAPKDKPYVVIENHDLFIKDKDLERFAINILKALKSKHLK